MNNINTQYKMSQLNAKSKKVTYSGYKRLDESTGGFRDGNCYLVGGIEKCGKSSYLMKMVPEFIKQGKRVLYINTELRTEDFFNRLVTIATEMELKEVEKNSQEARFEESLVSQWTDENKDKLVHYGIESDELRDKHNISFEKTMKIIEAEVDSGCDVVIVDNLTTFKINTKASQQQWELLSKIWTELINFTKSKGILTIVVVHTSGKSSYKENPVSVRKILKSDNPGSIFDDSVTVVTKPTLDDIYGGNGVKSQISGSMLIWRPYQKVAGEKYQKMSQVILDSFRNSGNDEIRMIFYGERLSFEEFQTMSYEETYAELAGEEEDGGLI